jgi:hypothetical protein
MGLTIKTGPSIDWRRDYIHGRSTGLVYFRRIPYLDFARAGDHKIIWELNRHQHLVLLAQAWLFSGRAVYLREIEAQLASWWMENPFQRGINWASALEVAFRALSWIWIWHFAASALTPEIRDRLLTSLGQHAAHLQTNLSFYFSPNTHLLGEAVALHTIGRLFPELPGAQHWEELGAAVAARQMDTQVSDDGSHFEQSSYYHVYALDMFLFHAVVAREVSSGYRDKLWRMGEYLHALLGPERLLPFIGDDDGGRFFHPYGERECFGRATIATAASFLGRDDWAWCETDLYEQAAWWLGRTNGRGGTGQWNSRLFADAGMAVLTAPGCHITFDVGPFGRGRAGHSHSDTLSLTVRAEGRDILIDPGTYTYVASPKERDRFRSSAAHSTIRVDGRDQGVPTGPFWWSEAPAVRLIHWSTSEVCDSVAAEWESAGIRHCRRVCFHKPFRLEIVDEVHGPPGEHEVEQFWHLASPEARRRIVTDGPAELLDGWRSRVFGTREPAPVLRLVRRTTLPVTLQTSITLQQDTVLCGP